MYKRTKPPRRAPLWFVIVAVLVALPAAAFPTLVAALPAGAGPMERFLVWGYPIYAVAMAFTSVYCYDERPWLAWILLAVMLLSHAAVWSMVLLSS